MDINSKIMKYFKFLLFLTTITHIADGCQIEGINSWLVPVEIEVTDIFRGVFFQRSTTNIIGINTISFGEGLIQGPYVELSYSNNQFTIGTNNNYPNYEENETAQSMAVTVVFNCAGGTTSALVLMIDITDTNNNAPQFRPNDQFEFTIAPPLSPNFTISGCDSGIIVRDIDLTTQRINFEIEENPYFQITTVPSSTPKEFTAILSTTTYIRTFPESLTLRISATDVDLTNDPPITTYGTIRIQGDNSFELPDDMVFTETFYLGNYEQNNEVSLVEPISLKQGFDAEVKFSIDGEYSNYFNLIGDDNKMSLIVTQPLPNAVQKAEKQIYLIVKAERELITASSATIVLNLPEDVDLLFEEPSYQGKIENNTLFSPQLILSQGYQGEIINIDIEYEHSSLFNANIQANIITLSMNNINQDLINENNYIQLKVIASTDRSSAVTVVTLEVIKDDNITPVFAKSVYSGTYDTVTGLTLEQLEIIQGFDNTVSIELKGDQSTHFSTSQDGQFITLSASQIPTNIFAERNLLFTVQASKPRTVGATAAVSISLPEARELNFDAQFYKGSIQNGTLTLGTILLKNGYDDDVNFTLSGDYSNFFDFKDNENEINIILSDQITDNIIKDNNVLILTLSAYGTHALPTTTSIILEIIKEDLSTPLFTKNIYYGNFVEGNKIEIENISLEQGYDDSVVFGIEGEFASYFNSLVDGNNVELLLDNNIPEEVIFNEKIIVFSVLANKPLTIGGRATVHIRFPDDFINLEIMTFANSTYLGGYNNNSLSLDSIILDVGYKPGTQFKLSGDYASYFTFNYVNNVVTISIQNALPIQILENNFIVLEVEASRDRAVSVSTIVIIDINKEEIVYPVFSELYYEGVYVDGQGLEIAEIYLARGYDEGVSFELDGDNSEFFRFLENGNSINLVTDGIPEKVLENNSHLSFSILAHKTDVLFVHSTIIIDLPKEIPSPLILGFEQKSYVGKIENKELQLVDLVLLEEYNKTLQFALTGELEAYFGVVEKHNSISIQLFEPIPDEITNDINFTILNIAVSSPESISGHATVIIDIIKTPEPFAPVFAEPFYMGEYTEKNGLVFTSNIQLSQGYDETVEFTLDGDDSGWFLLIENGQNNHTLSLTNDTMDLDGKTFLMFTIEAIKPNTISGKTTIVITLTAAALKFSEQYYVGSLTGTDLSLDTIILEDGYSSDVQIELIGEFHEYFTISHQNGIFTLQLKSELPTEVIIEKNILLFSLEAKVGSSKSSAIVIIELVSDRVMLEFDEIYYSGIYSESMGLSFEQRIIVKSGFDGTVAISLGGDDSQWFTLNQNGNAFSLIQQSSIPPGVLENNQQLIFTVNAQKPYHDPADATIIISLEKENTNNVLSFERINYVGTIQNGVSTLEPIRLSETNIENINITLFGELQNYFHVTFEANVIEIELLEPLPENVEDKNELVVLEIRASAVEAVPAYSTVIFEIIKPDIVQLEFNEMYYTGYLESEQLIFESEISLIAGYEESVKFEIQGDNSQWFGLKISNNSASLERVTPIPADVLKNNHQLIFLVTATNSANLTTSAPIIISILKEQNDTSTLLGFEKVSYTGAINSNISSLEPIVLTEGYSESVIFKLHGAMNNYFSVDWNEAIVTVMLETPISEDFLLENNLIILEIEAFAPNSLSAFATIIFELVKEVQDILVFEKTYYYGEYSENGGLLFDDKIILSKGYDDDVIFNLEGDSATWFKIDQSENSGSILLDTNIPADVIENNSQLIFIVNAVKINAITAKATVIITLNGKEEEKAILAFEGTSYLGTLEDEILIFDPIILSEGSSLIVSLQLQGELSTYFTVTRSGASVSITLNTTIPEEVIPPNKIIILELQASAPEVLPAFVTIIIEVVEKKVNFDKVLYNGIIQGNMVQHEVITVIGYTGTVYVTGAYENLFTTTLDNGRVSITTNGAIVLPSNVTSIFLELIADKARAVLVLNIENADTPGIPTITFSSETYDLQVNADQTGFIGQVYAYADNREAITYSLNIENEHLLQRISINVNGEINLSAPTTNGTYYFNVEATTVITRVTETASIILTVSDDITCTHDDIKVPPLIVINRDEEEPHLNLITSDFPGCQYVMTNRWPANQTWLYVDNDGLHTTAIDREHSSIAFMPLSQVQVELFLECEGDNLRHKRSVNYKSIEGLGPYDYGNSTWLLSETIEFNQRKTVVNLIVNDINDNKPIFDGKSIEPIVVGYPISEFENTILPRSLAELQASDADVGENALLLYWTSESVIAVSPTTGFVHVRQGVTLEDNMRLIVHATDRFGEGWTTSIELLVKLVDSRHIVVVTVRDVFLDDEKTILENLSTSVGYEVKALRSTIVTEDLQSSDGNTISRIKRATFNDVGTSMTLFVYGVVDKEPVPVEQLKNDISSIASAAVSIVNTVSLEDHLEGREICDISGRDTGLLIATIVLSVLLFILIMAIGLWFFLKWWKNRNYDEFSDDRSLESERKSIEELPKPESIAKPRLNIDDLRRSEKRLQEMLDAPINKIEVKPSLPIREIEVPVIQPHVIQSIDKLKKADDDSDEDEFGEQRNPKRKSVVTFNEKVEKIIHVEDDLNDDSDYEVYKL